MSSLLELVMVCSPGPREVMSLSQAYKLIRIVDSLPREKALSVGSERAALLIGYADATSTPDSKGSAFWLRVELPENAVGLLTR